MGAICSLYITIAESLMWKKEILIENLELECFIFLAPLLQIVFLNQTLSNWKIKTMAYFSLRTMSFLVFTFRFE
jgi:hypothetical protein